MILLYLQNLKILKGTYLAYVRGPELRVPHVAVEVASGAYCMSKVRENRVSGAELSVLGRRRNSKEPKAEATSKGTLYFRTRHPVTVHWLYCNEDFPVR